MTISPQLQPRGQIFYNFDFPSMASPYSKSQINPPCCELKGLAGLGPWLALWHFTPLFPNFLSTNHTDLNISKYIPSGLIGCLLTVVHYSLSAALSPFSASWHVPSSEKTSFPTQCRAVLPIVTYHSTLSLYFTTPWVSWKQEWCQSYSQPHAQSQDWTGAEQVLSTLCCLKDWFVLISLCVMWKCLQTYNTTSIIKEKKQTFF